MGQKLITGLQLIGTVTDALNFPTDNGIQSYRATASQLKNYVQEKISELLTPVGTVISFAGTVIPAGYLECDGSQISRATYSSLFGVTSTIHGTGNGSTTFHLPDYRGRFLRGHGGISDPDSASRAAMATGGATGNNVGSVQGDENKSHTHTQNAHTHAMRNGGGVAQLFAANAMVGGSTDNGNYIQNGASSGVPFNQTTTATNQNSGGNESRPKNAYVKFLIKY